MGFFETKIDSKNHMGAQMKGGEIKGSEVRVVFTAMDSSLGKNRSQVASICWSQDWYRTFGYSAFDSIKQFMSLHYLSVK
jgi:hypothetical protein